MLANSSNIGVFGFGQRPEVTQANQVRSFVCCSVGVVSFLAYCLLCWLVGVGVVLVCFVRLLSCWFVREGGGARKTALKGGG